MAQLVDIGIHPQFAGSKAKRRRFERVARRLNTLLYLTDERLDAFLTKVLPTDEERDAMRAVIVKVRCQRLYELAQKLQSEAELDLYLGQIPDDEVRAEVRKLIEPFCPFAIKQPIVVAASSASIVAHQISNLPIGPNNDGILPHEQDFREMERRLIHDDLPHEEQVRGAAMFLARSFELPVLQLIRDEGFEVFALKTRHAQSNLEAGVRPIDYTDDDLRRMYGYLLRELETREGRKAIHAVHG